MVAGLTCQRRLGAELVELPQFRDNTSPPDDRSPCDGPILGVLLAGGRSRRMGGGDKSLCPLGSGVVLDQVIARLQPQVDRILLNANGDPQRFARFGLPVARDTVEGLVGPLAGVLTGMEWASANCPQARWIVTVATDTPFLPTDLVARLGEAASAVDLVCAASGGRLHPVTALWPVGMAGQLRHALMGEKISRVTEWIARYSTGVVEFPVGEVDPFFNVNRPEDLVEAERVLARDGLRNR